MFFNFSFKILLQQCIMEDNMLWFTNLIGCTILYMIRKYCTCSGNTYKDNVFIPPWLTLFTSSLFNNPFYGPLNCDWFHCARQQAHSHVHPLLLSSFAKIISKLHLPGKSHLIVNFTVLSMDYTFEIRLVTWLVCSQSIKLSLHSNFWLTMGFSEKKKC